jgi:predicted nucleic acid-binding protein
MEVKMRVPRIYVETSIFNFYYTDDAPDKREDVKALFEEIKQGKYEPYTSDYVIAEIMGCEEPKQSLMRSLIDEFGVITLPLNIEAETLADAYVAEGIIPEKYRADGLHIAVTSVFGLDFIVSFNFQHIVKRKTIEMSEIVNYRNGYKRIGIYSPTEVIEND